MNPIQKRAAFLMTVIVMTSSHVCGAPSLGLNFRLPVTMPRVGTDIPVIHPEFVGPFDAGLPRVTSLVEEEIRLELLCQTYA